MKELASRQQAGAIHLCFFGEISTGKSSLIKALVPEADVLVSPVGGSTIDIRHYRWHNATGTQILLTDVPGTGGLQQGLDEMARQEALRSQLVIFVCDGDLTRPEQQAIRWLLALGKPLVLVMNKADRYNREEQAVLMERLLEHLGRLGDESARGRVVAVSAGGQGEVVEQSADGSEKSVRRERPADIGVLVVAINRMLEKDTQALDVRRDRAVFRLAADKLAEAETHYRQQRSEQIIRSSTRKAVIGALAAVSPGTDVLIQGYIGTSLTQQLCRLYGAAPRDLDVEMFLSLSQSRVGRALPLSLAVAGNGLKAFPGIGTVAGGIVHAVAYGLIFDALGRSLVHTLAKHGELLPEEAANEFEEGIGEHIEAGVRQVARMALDQREEKEADSEADGGAAHLALARESLKELISDSRLPAGIRETLTHDYAAVQAMLEKLEHGHLHIAAFGRVSTGKSSLLNALIGEDKFAVSPLHGETRHSAIEPWSEIEAGGVYLIDTPGLDEAGGEAREEMAKEVAERSDLVIFVLDGDITDSERRALKTLVEQGRPVVVALNKRDLYSEPEIAELVDSVRRKTERLVKPENVMAVAAQPRPQTVIVRGSDGRETETSRERKPDITQLRLRLWEIFESEGKTLAALNASLFAADLSDQVGRRILNARRELGDKLVRSYCIAKGIAVAFNPVPVADLFAAAFIDIGMIMHLSRVYGLPLEP